MDKLYMEHLLREKRQASASGSSSGDTDVDCLEGPLELACPHCYEAPLEFAELIDHLEEAHGCPQRVVSCPVCRRPARDMVEHLLQHTHLYEQATCTQSTSALRPSQHPTQVCDRISRVPNGASGSELGVCKLKQMQSGSSHELKLAGRGVPASMVAEQAKRAAGCASGQPTAGHKASSGRLKEAEKPVDRPVCADSPAMRVRFLEQLLLNALDLDRH
ncbi:hypothetical protein WJX72_000254 [[Myrmecia] bisecta]|uniref:Di19 zinc-binding domain-containing protein n=1 Tax=[Myrmecia] bisecta TaxID=41462 RepID=A0AAW1Q7Y7_9CHLO